MTEAQPRRGRPRGVESQHVMVRMPVDLIAQIDAYAASLQEQIAISDVNISRGMAIRELVKRGLQSVQAGPSTLPRAQAPTPQALLPPSHLGTVEEPKPMAAPPMAASQAPAVPGPEAAARSQRGRPGILRQPIMDCLQEHPEGLTAMQLKVYLGTNRNIGDTLSGMVRAKLLDKQGTGQAVRYTVRG